MIIVGLFVYLDCVCFDCIEDWCYCVAQLCGVVDQQDEGVCFGGLVGI